MLTPEQARAELDRRLLSGEYTQGKFTLKAVHQDTGEVRHCCLGVAGEIAVDEGLCKWVPASGDLESVEAEDLAADGWEIQSLVVNDAPNQASHASLPEAIVDLFGFRGGTAPYLVDHDAGSRSLALDNDEGENFKTIAERIRNDKSPLR